MAKKMDKGVSKELSKKFLKMFSIFFFARNCERMLNGILDKFTKELQKGFFKITGGIPKGIGYGETKTIHN